MKFKKLLTSSIAGALLTTMSIQGATYIGSGKWEVPSNWDTGRVPGDNGTGGLEQQNIIVLNDSEIDFDAATWTYLSANGLLHSTTEYRGALRLLMGENTNASTNGTHTLTFDFGNANKVNFTTGSSQAVGSRPGKDSTLNILSGIIDIGGNPFSIAGGGTGTINISGGSLIAGRSAPNLGTGTGPGAINISGGAFTSRAGLNLGSNGTFNVIGSAATEIGLGSAGSIDGVYTHAAGGVLSLQADIGGITKIFVADKGGSGVAATFDSGSLLDVGFVGAPVSGTWTVLEAEGVPIIDNGLAFALGVDQSVWSFNIDNTGPNGLVTVTAVAPELTWNGDMSSDWDTLTANWQGGATFSEPTVAFFDDTLSGSSTVNLTDTFSAVNIIVDNSANDYLFTGAGRLSGATGLVKNGTGELTLSNTGGNDFTGPLQLNDGTLTLGNATAFGDSGSALDINGGILDLGGFSVTKSTTDIAVASVNNGTLTSHITAEAGSISANLAGANTTLTKNGSGTLLLSGANTYDGTTTINDGILQLNSNSALGTSSRSVFNDTVTVENEKTVDALAGDPVLFVSDTSGLLVGDLATADGIPVGAVITAISADTTVTLDLSPTVTDVALVATFSREVEVEIETILGATAIAATATLDLNGSTTDEIISLLNGSGFNGNGAIINSNTSTPGQITTTIDDVGSFTVGGAGDVILSNVTEPAGVTRNITKIGAGTLTLSGDLNNNRLGLTVNEGAVNLAKTGALALGRFPLIVNNGSTVTLQGPDQLHNNLDLNGTMQINDGTLNLNGFDEDFARLEGSASGIVTNSSGTASTLTLLGGTIDAIYPGTISGNLSLLKAGTSTQTLNGTLSYSGDTTINDGILELTGMAATLDDNSAVFINGFGALLLPDGVTEVVDQLWIDGVQQPAGTYGHSNSAAANQDDFIFVEGTGILSVTSDPVAGTDYDTWAASFGLTGGATDDDDNDGVSNEDEYAFGTDPSNGGSVNPITMVLQKDAGTFSYTRRNPALSNLSYSVYTSTTLEAGDWTLDATAGQAVSATNGDNQTIEVTLTTAPTAPKFFVRVEAN